MAWKAIAYNGTKRALPIWDSNGLSFMPSNTDILVPEDDEPLLIMDMGGVIRNRPNPFKLPTNSEKNYIDFGLIWGEDIIDLIMSDRGRYSSFKKVTRFKRIGCSFNVRRRYYDWN